MQSQSLEHALSVIADVKISSAIGTHGSYLPLFCELKSVGLLNVHTLTFTSDDGSGENEAHTYTFTSVKIETAVKGLEFALSIKTPNGVHVTMLFAKEEVMLEWAIFLTEPICVPGGATRADSSSQVSFSSSVNVAVYPTLPSSSDSDPPSQRDQVSTGQAREMTSQPLSSMTSETSSSSAAALSKSLGPPTPHNSYAQVIGTRCKSTDECDPQTCD